MSSPPPTSTSSPANPPIVIVGAGLAGSMIALYLSKYNLPIKLIDYRDDFTLKYDITKNENLLSAFGVLTDTAKRSINLALSYRGIQALKDQGLYEQVLQISIPMKGRMLHSKENKLTFVPYGKGDQAILSVSRNILNSLIMNKLKSYKNVELIYNKKCRGIDKEGNIKLENNDPKSNTKVISTIASKFVIGADGAFSEVRSSMLRLSRTDYAQNFFKLGYKELNIPPVNGDFAMKDYDCLHIWPRKDYMLIALPNPDKSFTCTLFLPWKGEQGLDYFDNKATPEELIAFFNENFPDVLKMVPDIVEQWKSNPASALLTMHCSPWNFEDKVVILGDAAHAALPFFGQGMNCAFEDARSFDQIFKKHNGDVAKVLAEFSETREKAGRALQDLSEENYIEMSHTSSLWWFQIKKKIELFLNGILGDYWIPKYSMVTFTQIPYNEVIERSNRQDKIFWTVAYMGMIGVAGLAAKAAHIYLKDFKKK